MITIIDYGAGNIRSIQNMLKKNGIPSLISDKPEDIRNADKLILPGVGHFDHGMSNLRSRSLIEPLNERVLVDKAPILGICLGAQLLGNESEEGVEKGLSWIDMKSKKFDSTKMPSNFKIPHMAWNEVVAQKSSSLFNSLGKDPRFYFVHTYHLSVVNKSDVLSTTNYGYEFVSAVEYNNIYGVQFHPEKSHLFGLQLLKNFAEL